jgi:hypothetical protein
MWWSIPVIPALGRLRQKDHEFEDSSGHITRQTNKQRKWGCRVWDYNQAWKQEQLQSMLQNENFLLVTPQDCLLICTKF